MLKNKAGQKIAMYAHDTSADVPKTGDAANITGQYSLDGAATVAITDTNPTELDAADAPGVYIFDLEQAETNGDMIVFYAKSSTADVQLDPLIIDTVTAVAPTLTGTASAGDTTVKITLNGGVATDNYYNGQLVVITGGTGAGQSRTIIKYLADGSATPTRDFAVAPDNTSTFVLVGADVAGLLEAGKAQSGGVATITLDATSSSTHNIYVNNFIMITGGTGAGQTRLIGVYNGTSKLATIIPNWTTAPNNTSIYQILPMARVDVAGWLGNLVTGDGDWAALVAQTTAMKVVTDNMAAAATTMIEGTVSWDNTNATTTVIYSDDVTEATADHYNGRLFVPTSGALLGQYTEIIDYALDTGEGKFTVTALTEAPADDTTFVIL
jgi:hypothetical protein